MSCLKEIDLCWEEGKDDSFNVTISQEETGIAQAGTSNTITLSSDASSIADFYNNKEIKLTDGTGSVAINTITDYNGTTKVATLLYNWTVNPDITTDYKITGIVVDITGYTLYFTVKTNKGDTDEDAIISKDIISFTDPTNGVANISIDRADTVGLSGIYYYDIVYDDTVPNRIPIVKGTFTIKQAITDR